MSDVEGALLDSGLRKATTRTAIDTVDLLRRGEFSREAVFFGRVDFLISTWDDRLMPVECKISNSALNSMKRLREIDIKAAFWMHDLGAQVVPTAVLSGVFELGPLRSTQERGVTLFWGHNLPELGDWIRKTRAP